MDYKKKYENALERCKKAFNFNNLAYSHEEIRERLERVFPELKESESEDERIRKAIIKMVSDIAGGFPFEKYGIQKKKALTWLEKQGEQKPTEKVEPKFKVSDWILIDNPCQIESIDNNGNYIVRYCDAEETHLLSRNFCDSYFHLWTIQDAKEGDILACDKIVLIVDHIGDFIGESTIYSWYFADSKKFYGIGTKDPDKWSIEGFHPATKEQRDQLEKAMVNAGYRWNKEELKLEKV